MIRVLRVRRKIDGLGRNVYSARPVYKEKFKTPEEAREYYENLYYGSKILLDYETAE
jgi:hypothetical protein